MHLTPEGKQHAVGRQCHAATLPVWGISAKRGADGRQTLDQLVLETPCDRAIVFPVDAEIVLLGNGVGRVVGILVALAVAEPLRAGR